MSDAILTEMKNIIEKNLPAEVGNVLQNRLARLAELETLTANQALRLTQANNKINELNERTLSASAVDKRKAEVDQREAVLEEEQRNLDHKLEIAGLKTNNAIAIKEATVEIVKLVFCSPVSKKIIDKASFSSEQGQLPGQSYVSEVRRSSANEKVTEETSGPNLQG